MFKRVTRRLSRSSQDLEEQAPRDINKSVMTNKPCLVIAASSDTFDHAIIHRWKREGFDVHYEQVHGDTRSSTYAVEAHGDNLEPGESYAIVRCHPPLSLCLLRSISTSFTILPTTYIF
jgi:hypothetical protein